MQSVLLLENIYLVYHILFLDSRKKAGCCVGCRKKMNLNKKLSKKIISQCKVVEINIKFPLLTEMYNNELVDLNSCHDVNVDCSPMT